MRAPKHELPVRHMAPLDFGEGNFRVGRQADDSAVGRWSSP